MKTFGKNSISSIIRTSIDVMLIAEILSLFTMLIPINSLLHSKEPETIISLLNYLSQFIFGLVAILITLQLRKLLKAFKMEIIFDPRNVKKIKNISIFLFLYVIPNFIITLFKYQVLDSSNSSEGVLKIPITNTYYSFMHIVSAIDFKLLFASVVIYIIACVFQVGYELKEETTLTI